VASRNLAEEESLAKPTLGRAWDAGSCGMIFVKFSRDLWSAEGRPACGPLGPTEATWWINSAGTRRTNGGGGTSLKEGAGMNWGKERPTWL